MSEYIKKEEVNRIVDEYMDGTFRWSAMAIQIGRLQTYSFSDSADIEKIKAEIIQDIQNGVIQITKGSDRLFEVIDKYIGGDSK